LFYTKKKERLEEVQFIKDKGRQIWSSKKQILRRLGWLIPVCLLHVMLIGGLFVAIAMPQAMPVFAQEAQHMHHVVRSSMAGLQGRAVHQCQDREDDSSYFSDVCDDDATEGPDENEETPKPPVKASTEACPPADESEEDVFRSYRVSKTHASCATPAPTRAVPTKSVPTKEVPVSKPDPDLAIAKTTEEGNNYLVGQQVTFNVLVTNVSGVQITRPISVTDSMPAGFTTLSANGGSSWSFAPISGTSPQEIRASYKGPFPVAAGQQLPVIKIRGVLTASAPSTLTNVATVDTPGDSNAANNTAEKTIAVGSGNGYHAHFPSLPSTGSDPRPLGDVSPRP
jgi:uncharacterized repeat protein (TIGR01451 family)